MFSFKKFLTIFNIFLLFVFVAIEVAESDETKRVPLEVFFLDVEQGDATLINYQNRYQILIDGGPNGKRLLAEIGKAMPVMDKNIEIVVLTHPDKDHLAGLIDVFKNYSVGLYLDNGQKAETEIFAELEKEIERREIRREGIGEGSKIGIGNLSLQAFNPDILSEEDKDRNEQSVVLRLDFFENSFLFTGDSDEKTEKDMASDGENVNVDFLRVGHHGSKSSTGELFLEKVTPEKAVISSGKDNRYGHPHQEVLERLENGGIEIFRTDEMGTIKFECGKECVVSSQKD